MRGVPLSLPNCSKIKEEKNELNCREVKGKVSCFYEVCFLIQSLKVEHKIALTDEFGVVDIQYCMTKERILILEAFSQALLS